MKNPGHILSLFILLNLVLAGNLTGQDWKFVKEKDGIKVFTKKEDGNNLKKL